MKDYSFEERSIEFWKRVNKTDGCWEWTGAMLLTGYGQMLWVDRKCAKAHRISWIIENGNIPDGMCICHHCDNRKCVRPDHLFLGTIADNNRDMDAKGRRVNSPQIGSKHWKARLSDSDIVEIRKLHWKDGVMHKDIAAIYGVGVKYIARICRGGAWKHVPMSVPMLPPKEARMMSRAKLKRHDVLNIVSMHKLGSTNADLADKFGVSRSNISHIVTGKSWGHLNLLAQSDATNLVNS
jgi:hypothetical protein